MDKIVNIQNVDPNTFQLQNYSSTDEALISNFTQQDITFNPSEDYLEYYILDLNQNILFSNVYGYPGYKLRDNLVSIDPQNDLESQGYIEGQYYTLYNFLKRKLSSNATDTFYIQDISTDRTELRLNTTKISNTDVVDLTTQFASQIANSTGSYLDFYLNFGNNQLVIANNIALDNTNPNDPTVLIKLYEPLPQFFTFNSQCWVVEQIAESQAYQIELTTIFAPESEYNYISGPNFNLDVQDQINNSTNYINQNTLQNNSSTLGSGSLTYQINSLLAEKGIEINIDYSDYSQFVNFSSAQTRLENFYYKLALIEEYTYSASLSNTAFPSSFTTTSSIIWKNKINNIITNFDGYEYYLYYESGSYAWPKTNVNPPYINVSTTNIIALNWFTTQSLSASLYDSENNNNLINSIPTYLREDNTNEQYFLFVQMVGQHFDNVWTYTKDITNKFDADNRLNYGISKDIVAQAIRDLGVKIYQNNFSTSDLYSGLLGITYSGSLFNVPYITGSLPTPTGFEYINTRISASSPNALEPLDDVNKEIYKRIYHNLPILLKKKGSLEGLRMLVNLYGIPDTILRLNEFSGKNTSLQNNYDNFVDQFNYAFTTSGSGWVQTSYDILNGIGVNPQFRFKTFGIPLISPYHEVLFNTFDNFGTQLFSITLDYTGSRFNSGSYSGSIVNPYNEYGTLTLWDEVGLGSCSIYLPFYNGDWWSVTAVMSDGGTTVGSPFTLYAQNSIYNGYDGNQIGFQASASTTTPDLFNSGTPELCFLSYVGAYTPNGASFQYLPFSGSFQEFQLNTALYFPPLAKSHFDDFTMNPYSIEGNTITAGNNESSYNYILFRAPLGTMLDNDVTQTTRTSIHPGITLNPPILPSLTYDLGGTFTFEPNYETIYQDQFNSGVKNSISEKIRIVDSVLPEGNTLSQYISVQQTPITGGFTKDINYFEAAFSPQDEVNDDIIAQLGPFNIGDYIGDPRNIINSTLNYYPDFNKLRDFYFSKYTHSYDLNDYIRLIKFFDNSLFKMIKDFTPARTGLASGLVIKQTLLERQRYPAPRATTNSVIAFVGNPTSSALNIFY